MNLLEKLTGETPVMWGPTIVGYGSYRYTYPSGRSGESCATGFAIRAREIVIYVGAECPDRNALLEKLGKYRLGVSCLYFRRLADLDIEVLEQLIAGSLAELRRLYPPASN